VKASQTKVNVRIIAATNRDLQNEIIAGHFRQDLFYRISVFQIHLPALRERISDIELLANYFLRIYSTRNNKKINHISHDFLESLKLHPWHGNIRELKNIIERSVILTSGDTLELDSLPQRISSNYSGQ
jgi:two-component system NtrC family response regulator